MENTWILLSLELLIAGSVVALAVRELVLLRRYERRAQDPKQPGSGNDEPA